MSEQTPSPVPPPDADVNVNAPDAGAPDVNGPALSPQDPAPRAGRSRRGTALAAAGALVAVAAAGGIGYAVLHGGSGSAHAGRPATTAASTPWTQPAPTATKAFGARSGGSHYGSLRLLLLPVPDNYGPGPDVETYGNDVVLDSAQAIALVKGEQSDTAKLTAKQRRDVDAYIAELHIEGAGLRTYLNHDNELVVRMEIVQMRNQRVAHAETKLFGEVAHAMGVFRNGPRITGHPQATCILPPKDKSDTLGWMLCQATEGDLLIKMRVEGIAPLDTSSAADLLRRQLDRVQDPGESV